MKTLDIVSPFFNEESIISKFIDEIEIVKKRESSRALIRLILINDGSSDNSLKTVLLKNHTWITVINLSRNFGHQAAISAGISHADADYVLTLDSDLQDPPELISEFIDKIYEEFDIVFGVRTIRLGETLFKLWSAKMYYKFLSLISESRIVVNAGDYIMFSRKIQKVFLDMDQELSFNRGVFAWMGFKNTSIYYQRNERESGKSKYTLSKMLNLAKNGIINFSNAPLKISGYLSILSIIFGLGIFIYVLSSGILKNSDLVKGWASLFVSVYAFGIMTLISLNILSIYVINLKSQVRKNPKFIVDEIITHLED
jgi:glycosyltransferase involved in cell wall biosynthesis